MQQNKEKILVVDDEQGWRELLEDILTKDDEVETASNLKEAIELLKKKSFDLAIIDIIPYIIREENCVLGELYFTLEIKNIGDIPVEGIKYFGNSSYRFRNKNYGSAWGGLLMGVLNPGEKWIPKGGAGLLFVNYIPSIFSIEYEITPTDSNPDNNYLSQVYLVKGGGLFPFWIRLPFFE